MGIEDEVEALDFDLICTHRIEIYEGEKIKGNAKLIAYEVCKMAFGTNDSEADVASEAW